eukprot:813468-Prymnesium_polylepis.3
MLAIERAWLSASSHSSSVLMPHAMAVLQTAASLATCTGSRIVFASTTSRRACCKCGCAGTKVLPGVAYRSPSSGTQVSFESLVRHRCLSLALHPSAYSASAVSALASFRAGACSRCSSRASMGSRRRPLSLTHASSMPDGRSTITRLDSAPSSAQRRCSSDLSVRKASVGVLKTCASAGVIHLSPATLGRMGSLCASRYSCVAHAAHGALAFCRSGKALSRMEVILGRSAGYWSARCFSVNSTSSAAGDETTAVCAVRAIIPQDAAPIRMHGEVGVEVDRQARGLGTDA